MSSIFPGILHACGELRGNPPGHKIAVVILEAELAIECLAGCIGAFDLEMEGVNAQFGALLQDKLYGFRPYPLIAVAGCNEEFINEGITPVIFKIVPKRHDNVSNGFIFMVYQPDTPERRISYYFLKCRTCCLLI